MGFTFVADRASSSRLLSTFPRGNAVAGPSSPNGLISDMSCFISSGFEFQDRTERERVESSEKKKVGKKKLPFDFAQGAAQRGGNRKS